MQRGQRAQLPQGGDDFVGDQATLLEFLAAVHHPVADGVDLIDVLDALACTGGHLFDQLKESLGVGGENRRGSGLVAVRLMGDHAALHADALAQAFAQHLLAFHIDQLILQGGRTAVDNQNFHLLVASCFISSTGGPLWPTLWNTYKENAKSLCGSAKFRCPA